jgi:hypothetical protein
MGGGTERAKKITKKARTMDSAAATGFAVEDDDMGEFDDDDNDRDDESASIPSTRNSTSSTVRGDGAASSAIAQTLRRLELEKQRLSKVTNNS